MRLPTHNRKGIVTLIELLIAFGVWVTFATLATVNIMHYDPDVRVEAEAFTFYSQLIYTRNLALTGAVYEDQLPFNPPCDSIPCPDGIREVPNGYGMYIDTATTPVSHWIYADLYDPALYVSPDPDTIVGNNKYDLIMDGKAEKIPSQTITVDAKLQVKVIDNATATELAPQNPATPKPFEIFFTAPDGKIIYYYDGLWYDDSSDPLDKIAVEIAYIKDPTILRTIFIQRSNQQIYFKPK